MAKRSKILTYPQVAIDFTPRIPPMPKFKDKSKVDVRYCLIAPFAYAHIYWDEKEYDLVYDVEEPILDEKEKRHKDQILNAMRNMINFNTILKKEETSLFDYIDQRLKILAVELGMEMSYESYKKIYYYLCRDFIGFNETEPLLRDYFVEDIECNGANSPVYIVHRVFRNLRTKLQFPDPVKLESFVEKLAQRCGKYISYAQPILDGSLPDGSRVNATYTKDITSKGPTFTIRKFTKTPWTPTQLIGFGTLSPEMLAYFWLLIEYKMNLLVVGGTASGKTTLLNAIAFFIPPESRVVSIEDSVTGDSKIIIKQNGKIKQTTIKDLVDNKLNAEVLSLDGEGKTVFVKPSDYIKHNVKKDIYEITTGTGRKIKVTQDHSLFTLGDKGLKEVKPVDLKEGKSFVAVPRKLPIKGNTVNEINLINHLETFKKNFLCGEPIKKIFEKYKLKDLNIKKERYRWWKNNNIIKIENLLELDIEFTHEELKELKIKSSNNASLPILFEINKDFLEFCGLWLGDGSYDNYNENSVIVSNNDQRCRELIKKISKKVESKYSLMSDGGTSIRIHNSIFYKFMKDVLKFDGYSSSKKIPNFILNLDNKQIKDFIRGYFSADGGAKKSEISCSSQSYELLQDMQTLLLRLEIISRINDFDRKDKCINLSISNSENIEKFKEICFLQDRKNNLLFSLNKKAHHTFSDVIPLSIESFERLRKISEEPLQHNYYSGKQNIGRRYLRKIAPIGSEFNDLSHNDLYWDKIKKVRKVSSDNVEVFDLSIPKHEKFLCNNIFVHNTRELNLPRENWLPSVSRDATGVGGVGEIDLYSLLRASFRQNPDYVIVGEVRGKEASVLFQGMASGHSSISTVHADSIETVIKRLETPPIELSPTLLNVLDSICVMTHAIVKNKETRKLREIVEVVNVDSEGTATTNTPFMWNSMQDRFYFKRESKLFAKISKRFGLAPQEITTEFRRRSELLYKMYQKKIFGFHQVHDMINEYYKKPEKVLEKFKIK